MSGTFDGVIVAVGGGTQAVVGNCKWQVMRFLKNGCSKDVRERELLKSGALFLFYFPPLPLLSLFPPLLPPFYLLSSETIVYSEGWPGTHCLT